MITVGLFLFSLNLTNSEKSFSNYCRRPLMSLVDKYTRRFKFRKRTHFMDWNVFIKSKSHSKIRKLYLKKFRFWFQQGDRPELRFACLLLVCWHWFVVFFGSQSNQILADDKMAGAKAAGVIIGAKKNEIIENPNRIIYIIF